MTQQAVLLIGSPRGEKSTSASLGGFLAAQLTAAGVPVETHLAHRALRTDKGMARLLAAVEGAELLVLAFPVYIDSLPYLLVKALEQIAAQRSAHPAAKRQRLVAITNCGFPEADHTRLALAMCAQFAHECGFEWSGGFGLGEGGFIEGQPLASLGGMVKYQMSSLTAAAQALAAGEPISPAVMEEFARPMIPGRMYLLAATMNWHLAARKHGVWLRLKRRPYPQTRPLADA